MDSTLGLMGRPAQVALSLSVLPGSGDVPAQGPLGSATSVLAVVEPSPAVGEVLVPTPLLVASHSQRKLGF